MIASPRLLITGANGAIGRRLRRRLEAEGSLASYLVGPNSKTLAAHPFVDVVDVTDSASLGSVIGRRKPEAIIHLAAVAGADCEADPDRAFAVNVEAVRTLTSLALENGVPRIVLASTCAVYGDQYDHPVSEDGELVPSSGYAQLKRQAELVLAEAVANSTEFTAVALRIFNVYGPGMESALPNRLLAADEGSPISLAGLDEFIRDYVHVDDVVDALLRAAAVSPRDGWLIANVGSGRPTSNRGLVAALNPVHFEVAAPRHSYSCADTKLATEVLGFTAGREMSRQSVG